MKTFAHKYLSGEEFSLFLEMRNIFESLPDFSFEQPISCHVICRAFAENYPVTCVDGYFGTSCQHSWLIFKQCNVQEHDCEDLIIADMYPVGGITPFLLHDYFYLPWHRLYREDPTVTDSFRETSWFQEQVTAVATTIHDLQISLTTRA